MGYEEVRLHRCDHPAAALVAPVLCAPGAEVSRASRAWILRPASVCGLHPERSQKLAPSTFLIVRPSRSMEGTQRKFMAAIAAPPGPVPEPNGWQPHLLQKR